MRLSQYKSNERVRFRALKMEAKTMTAQQILFNWCVDGYDTVAQSSSDGHCYPCNEADIPSGAIDSYAPNPSHEAVEMLQSSMAEGWKYD